MKVTWIVSDSHFNHDRIATYCKRPENFTELIIKNWQAVVKPEDLVIHLGDVAIGNRRKVKDILAELPGRKALVLGNHDRMHGPDWWMAQGFAFACQAMIYRNCWLTHEPAKYMPEGCTINIHGHLHNFEREVHPNYFAQPFHRLFAVEYTQYRPVNFDKFVAHPDKYKARIHHREIQSEQTSARVPQSEARTQSEAPVLCNAEWQGCEACASSYIGACPLHRA